eukprot:3855456-Rhodomonas_salina.1
MSNDSQESSPHRLCAALAQFRSPPPSPALSGPCKPPPGSDCETAARSRQPRSARDAAVSEARRPPLAPYLCSLGAYGHRLLEVNRPNTRAPRS